MSEKLSYPFNPSEYEKKEANVSTEIPIKSGNTQAKISPEKGSLVTSFKVDGKDVLFVDNESFADPRNVKYKMGIPILFPYAGPRGEAPQHGGAREVPWVWKDRTENSATVSLDFETLPDEMKEELKDKDLYGKDFNYYVEAKITVGEGLLGYDLSFKNKSKTPKPFAPGLHPYFAVDHKRIDEMKTNLNADLLKRGPKSIIVDRPEGDVWFTLPDGRKVTISSSPEFKKIVIWSEKQDSDYICIEPFVTDPKNKEEEIVLNPGEEKQLSVEFKVEQKGE